MFGPPSEEVAVAVTVFAPATSSTVNVRLRHTDHPPVPPNAAPAAATVPFTAMSMGRFASVPFAYRIVSVARPAAAARTVHWIALPTTFS